MVQEETTTEGTVQEPTEEAKTEPTDEYKEIQRTLSKREQELAGLQKELEVLKAQQPNREIAEAITEMGRQQSELFERIEELGKRQEAADEGKEYKPPDVSEKRKQRELRRVADEILVDHGYNLLDPNFREARRDADPVRAVNRRIRELRQEEDAKRQTDIDKIVAERVEEKWQQKLKDHAGVFKAESGAPSGSVGDDQQWLAEFNAGRHNTKEDHEKARKILSKLQGGFK